MINDRCWFDASPDALLVVDATGLLIAASRRVETLLGWKPDELVGQSIETVIPPRFRDHVLKPLDYATSPRRRPMGSGFEISILHRSGEEIRVDVALNPVSVDGASFVVASFRDTSAGMDLAEQFRLQSAAVAAAASGIVITSREGIIVSANPAACRMTGYTASELVGQKPSILKSSEHDPSFYAGLWATVVSGRTWSGDIVNRRKDGSLYHEEQTIAPVRNDGGEITHFIAVKQDVTERVLAEEALRTARDELARRVVEVEALHSRLRDQATRDPLTGLLNRRYLDETLPRELASTSRSGGHLTLAVIDIDHFKRVNDRHGHAAGDVVLLELGRILGSASRSSDVACRYGGEEFVVLLKGAELCHGVRRVEEWRRLFAATTVPSGESSIQATFSAGVAEWRPAENADELFARADAALYAAKRSGRNRVSAADSPPCPPEPEA